MKRLLLVISDRAMLDLIDIWTYIAEKNTENADSFIDKLYEKCELLVSSPHIGKKRDELGFGIRSFAVGRYILFYRIQNESIEIVRILNGYRDIDSFFLNC